MPTRVYVGDLGDHGTRAEIQQVFEKHGRVVETWVARNPPGFAFVFFESHREAEHAVKALDGARLCGVTIRVEIAKGPDKGEKSRNGPKCHECGRIGHSERECTRRRGYVFRGRNSTYERRTQSNRHRSRSNSRDRDRGYSRRRSRSRSTPRRSPPRRSPYHKNRRDSRRSADRQRSRSRSVERNRSPYRGNRGNQHVYNDDMM